MWAELIELAAARNIMATYGEVRGENDQVGVRFGAIGGNFSNG